MRDIKKLVITSLCIAIGVVLPQAFHAIPYAGSILLPMHISILLCGLICGPIYGLGCGLFTPLLSHAITGMPPVAILPGMLIELAIYGFTAGLLFRVIKTKWLNVNILASLIIAMLLGRIGLGITNALVMQTGTYSFSIWISAVFIKALPGICIQLVVIPVLVFTLIMAKLFYIEEETLFGLGRKKFN